MSGMKATLPITSRGIAACRGQGRPNVSGGGMQKQGRPSVVVVCPGRSVPVLIPQLPKHKGMQTCTHVLMMFMPRKGRHARASHKCACLEPVET